MKKEGKEKNGFSLQNVRLCGKINATLRFYENI